MIYENSEQIKECIKRIMADEKVSYNELAMRMGGTKQNAYKLLNKMQLKLDDVKIIAEALGYKVEINIIKENEQAETDLYDIYINEEFMKLFAELIKLAKDVDYQKIYKTHLELKDKSDV